MKTSLFEHLQLAPYARNTLKRRTFLGRRLERAASHFYPSLVVSRDLQLAPAAENDQYCFWRWSFATTLRLQRSCYEVCMNMGLLWLYIIPLPTFECGNKLQDKHKTKAEKFSSTIIHLLLIPQLQIPSLLGCSSKFQSLALPRRA